MEQKNVNQGVYLVTIKKFEKLYKNGEEAKSIQLVYFEENDFRLVVQKGIYKKKDKAIFIVPDFCVIENDLFKDFVKPNGDYSKSYLGKIKGIPARIKAKSFNFHSTPKGTDKVYSNGILLPLEEVFNYFLSKPEYKNYDKEKLPITNKEALGVYKYEREATDIGGDTLEFPQGIYKTGETNIELLLKQIEKMEFPLMLYGSEKVDGSSITLFYSDEYPEGVICSKNKIIKPTIKVKIGERKLSLFEKFKSLFGYKINKDIFEEIPNVNNMFIKSGTKYLDILKKHKLKNIILRGELYGGNAKGSGNPNNEYKGYPLDIKFFGLDYLEKGVAKRRPQMELYDFCIKYKLPIAECLFYREFKSLPILRRECKKIFKNRPNMEGIVVRSTNGNFSAKIMNQEYDSKN